MIEKEIDFQKDAKDKLLSGVNKIANAVKSTLGAAGTTVILEDDLGRPHVTKDGVTVARYINLSDLKAYDCKVKCHSISYNVVSFI